MRSKLRTLALLAVPAAALFAMPAESSADHWRWRSSYSRPYYGGGYYRGYDRDYDRGYHRGYYNRGYYGRGYGSPGYYGRGRSYYFSSPWGSFQYHRR